MGWNGKVKCIENKIGHFTANKIYEVKNGLILDDWGWFESFETSNTLSKFEEIKEIPKLCEILGVDINEDFKVEFDNGTISEFIYCIIDNGFSYRTNDYKREITPLHIVYSLINGNYKVIRFSRYKFSPDEIILLKALYYIGYKYLAKDKDGKLTAFKCKPIRNEDIFGSLGDEYIEMETKLFQQIKFEDEPLEIKCVLD